MRPATRNDRRFLLLGLGLTAAFLVCLAVCVYSELTWRTMRTEFYSRFPQSFARRDRFWAFQRWMRSGTYSRIRSLAILFGLGDFLWLETLLGKGIARWVKRRG